MRRFTLNFSKFLCIIAVLALALCACGSQNGPSNSNTSNSETVSPSAPVNNVVNSGNTTTTNNVNNAGSIAGIIIENGTLRVSEIGAYLDPAAGDDAFERFAQETFSGGAKHEAIKKIVVGDAELSVKQTESSFELTAVRVHGKDIDISDLKEKKMYGNLKFQAFWAGDTFVFGVYDWWGSAVHFVTKDSDVKYAYSAEKQGAWYNNEKLYFGKDGDGIAYRKTLAKFDNIQAAGGQMEYCTGRDELYEELGTVAVSAGGLKYTKASSKTISEAFDISDIYAKWVKTMGLDSSVSLDEYLKKNREQYAK